MRKALERRAPEIAGFGLLLVIATLAWLGREFVDQNDWVTHSLEVEKSLGKVLSTVQDAETGQRGYLLTGDKAFLAPYTRARAELDSQLQSLEGLTADNADQVASLLQTRRAIADRFASLAERIADYDRGALDPARLHFGREQMGHVREAIARMQEVEGRLLGERTQSAAATRRWVAAAAFLAACFCLGMIVYWIASSRRYSAELSAYNKSLIQAMADREAGEDKIRQMQKMEAVGQLTGGIAHDFNNMLAVVIGALGLAQKRLAKGDMDVASLLVGAMDGANRAATLTKRLLAFSRQQPLSPQALSANTVVAGLSDLIRRTIGQEIVAETVLGGGLWTIHADPLMLENAIINLCVNARDAMPEGGRLTIETANVHLDEAYAADQIEVNPGQYAMIAVSDTGTGMTPDVVKQAFEPFFTTKGAGKGTGLGLSQVHGFVKQSGGHIKVYSEPGSGTTVKMYFPRFVDPAGSGKLVTQGGRPARAIRAGDRRHVILVVEDDARVRETTVAMLRDLGYSTIHADGAAPALRMLDTNNVTLLFTDIVMPEVNGRKLADEALKRYPELKVLFTTGFTRNAVVHNGILDGGVQLLQKPFTLEELASKVHHILNEVMV